MSVRGVFGFRLNGKDKVSYNHRTSEPSGLGISMAEFVRTTPAAELRTIAAGIELVDRRTAPTAEQIADCKAFTDTGISTHQRQDWYVLLAKAEGNPNAWRKGLRYMPDASASLHNSLVCEWAYIVDVDTDTFEIYTGLQKHKGTGRYNDEWTVLQDKDGTVYNSEYTGVALLQSIPAGVLRALSKDEAGNLLCAIETLTHELDADGDNLERVAHAKAIFKRLMAVKPADSAYPASPAPTAEDLLRTILEKEHRHEGVVLTDELIKKLETYLGNLEPGKKAGT
jgi:hypothetical protein